MALSYFVFWGVELESSRRWVIFDVDGTLNQTRLYAVPAYRRALRAFDRDVFKDDEIVSRIGAPFKDDVKFFFGEKAAHVEADFTNMIRAFWFEEMEKCGRTFPGTKEMLDELKKKGYALAICSNASDDELATVLSYLEIFHEFERIQGLTKANCKKDSLKTLLKEIAPAKAVMVGDRFYDYEAAQENGIPFVACCYGYAPEGELRECPHRISNIRELPELVDALF